jgi:MoxR-like ATPase
VFWADRAYRPIVVLTSNSEKNLPDAFLRRVVFYHIEFPNEERLKEIVRRRLGDDGGFTPAMLENAIAHFIKIRDLGLKKQPATAEFLAWLRIIRKFGIDIAHLKNGDKEKLAFSYSILSKNFEDAKKLRERLASK